MNIIQTFYNNLVSQYDKLFLDWQSATKNNDEVLWETPANFSEYASLEEFYEYLTTQERAKDYISTTGQWEVVMETKFINTRREGIIT